MFITNSDRLIARRLARRRPRTVGETAKLIANCRGYPLSNAELFRLAKKMVRHAARNRDKDREDCDDWDEEEDRCLDDDDDDDTDNQRRTRNTRHLELPTVNWTYERQLQGLMDRGYSASDAALVAAADFHSFDSGPSRMMSGGMHSMDTQYAPEAPPPASFPREAQYGKDGRGVRPLTRTPPGLPDADEDDHDVASLFKFADQVEGLPLPETTQKLVARRRNELEAGRKKDAETP
jgi:hypothetical protein